MNKLAFVSNYWLKRVFSDRSDGTRSVHFVPPKPEKELSCLVCERGAKERKNVENQK